MNRFSFIPRSESPVIFGLAMASYAWALSSLINTLVRLFNHATRPVSLLPESLFWFTPFLDVALLVGVIELLRIFRSSDALQILFATLVLCASKSLSWSLWGIILLPVFVLTAFAYVYWRRTSWVKAFGVALLITLLQNVIPALRIIFGASYHAP